MPFSTTLAGLAVASLLFGGTNAADAHPASMRIALCNGGFVDIPVDRQKDGSRDDCMGLACHAATERRRKAEA
ncbi:hypothetical protein [Sphingomonas sp. KC8]|uniref:hypothetical protein n=1 Tax=Sphingomonas sp. KC8 TaxID=1030157 RepID=UPI00024885FE|nr:hypothetical protein [Sphingomonas sp. KC8]ARS28916.1 hypothetical protein KC8_16735 [Sphingomonas sp. KC8]